MPVTESSAKSSGHALAILNTAEAIVLTYEPKDRPQVLRELGEHVSPGNRRGGYQSAYEWVMLRKPRPSANTALAMQEWNTRTIAAMKPKQRTAYRKALAAVTAERD